MPWAIVDRYGKLLLKRGEIIKTEDLMRAVLQRGLVDESVDERLQRERERDRQPRVEARQADPGLTSIFRRVRGFRPLLEQIMLDLQSERGAPAARLCGELADRLLDACRQDMDAALAAFQVDAGEDDCDSSARAIQCAVLCALLAESLDLPIEGRGEVICAALTHDVGMYPLSDALNRQRAALTDAQRKALVEHTEVGALALQAAGVQARGWVEAVRQHHERADGSGYPHGLSNQHICVEARMVALVDIYTAMVRPRAYRDALPTRDVLRALFLQRGSQVDEGMAAAFIREIGVYPPGTFVRLQNAEVAVVVRRGDSAATPMLRAVVSASGTPLVHPPWRDSREAGCAIAGIVPVQRFRSILGRVHELWDEGPPGAGAVANPAP